MLSNLKTGNHRPNKWPNFVEENHPNIVCNRHGYAFMVGVVVGFILVRQPIRALGFWRKSTVGRTRLWCRRPGSRSWRSRYPTRWCPTESYGCCPLVATSEVRPSRPVWLFQKYTTNLKKTKGVSPSHRRTWHESTPPWVRLPAQTFLSLTKTLSVSSGLV